MSAVAELPPEVVQPPRATLLDAVCDAMADDWSPWHVVLSGLTWSDYERLLEARAAAGRRAVRIVYDRGTAEVYNVNGQPEPSGRAALTSQPGSSDMTVGNRHERWKTTIARLMGVLSLGFRVDVVGAGNVTISRDDLDRGFEPDECYYIQNAARVMAVRELDFATDPPPDLAVEVEITRTVLAKLDLYDALGVPEVWRWDGERLTVLHRQPAGGYVERPASLAFPLLTRDRFAGYLGRLGAVSESALSRELLAWADAARTTPPPPETA